ncbi:MAG: Tad domain-containing protein [Pseudomonadota bacterium]
MNAANQQQFTVTYAVRCIDFQKKRQTGKHVMCGDWGGLPLLLYRELKAWIADTSASMATQVVIFSVMLFGTSGVVLDFGRVYSEHSQMQAYTDQAALAAASELDQKPDSIRRAVEAVFGTNDRDKISKSAVFSEGDGNQFNISHLYFLRDISDDDGQQTNFGTDLIGDNRLYVHFAGDPMPEVGSGTSLAAADARFVVAVADERSVRNSLMRLINSTGSDAVEETNVVRTISAAKPQVMYHGDSSNLVMCNPFEGDTNMSFGEFVTDPNSKGYQFKLEADGLMSSDGSGLTALNSLARRQNPEGLSSVNEVCGNPLTMPGFDAADSAAENAMKRNICIMSSAVQGELYTPQELTIVAAEPELITTSLNTAFDMWDYPISEVLDWNADAARRDDSPLFQPDLNILKGRIHNQAIADANEALGIPRSSRLNYVEPSSAPDYDLMLLPCLANPLGVSASASCYSNPDGETLSFVGVPPTATGASIPYLTEYYTTLFSFEYLNTFMNPVEQTPLLHFYDVYLEERINYLHTENGWSPLFPGASSAAPGSSLVSIVPDPEPTLGFDPADTNALREDGSLSRFVANSSALGVEQISKRLEYDPDGNPLDEDGDGFQDITDAFPNYRYTNADGEVLDNERRVMDIAVINCGRNQINDEGDTVAEIAGFAKTILMQPALPVCADGSDNCLNENLVSSSIIVEFIGEGGPEPEKFAVLVR